MKYLSVCSGMEAASVAWHPLGWTPVGFSEIEKFPCAILAHRFPQTPNYGDLTKYTEWPLSTGDVDILAGGPPCQAFSVAGLRRGLADPRGNLTLTYLGLVEKLQPRYVVYENVPGLLSVDGGRAFGSFLGGLAELGYSAAWRVLDAQHVGSCRMHPHQRGQSAVPQRRRRVFVVAVRGAGNWRLAAEILSIAEGMRGNTPSRRKKGQGVAAGSEGGAGADDQSVCATGEVTHCLTASQKGATEDGTGRGTPIVIDRAAFNQGANAQYEPHIGESEVMDSLVARGPHAVGQPLLAMRESGQGYWMEDEKAGTLRAEGENRPSRPSHVIAQPIAFQPGNLRRQGGADPSTVTFPTLTKDSGDQSPPVAIPPMAVRRLTPVECERLQGFPDNWSRIPWKGKPEDQCPDGPRYKACGNSMAVPVMAFIGRRIAEVDAKYACNKTAQ